MSDFARQNSIHRLDICVGPTGLGDCSNWRLFALREKKGVFLLQDFLELKREKI
jgi:hypothetical protein